MENSSTFHVPQGLIEDVGERNGLMLMRRRKCVHNGVGGEKLGACVRVVLLFDAGVDVRGVDAV